MAVLANSGPYEGAVLCALVVGALLWHRLRRRDPIRLSASTLAAFLIVLLPALAALGFYNLRVTGHPLRLPYQVHEATYGITPLLIGRRPEARAALSAYALRDFHVDLETVGLPAPAITPGVAVHGLGQVFRAGRHSLSDRISVSGTRDSGPHHPGSDPMRSARHPDSGRAAPRHRGRCRDYEPSVYGTGGQLAIPAGLAVAPPCTRVAMAGEPCRSVARRSAA